MELRYNTVLAQPRQTRKKRDWLNALVTMPFTHILLLLLGFFYIYPLLWMVAGSFKTLPDFFNQGLSLIPAKWEFKNYVEAWTTAKFGVYFGNTVFVTVFSVLFTILFSSMAGFAIARLRVFGKKTLIAIMLVIALLPKGYTALPTFEIINWLGLNNSLWGIIVLHASGGLLFNAFLFAGYFNTTSKEIEEAAIVDGASIPRLYWNIAMPLALPMIATISLFTFIGSWNDFFWPLILTLGDQELRTLAVGMYAFTGEHSQFWQLTCAGATISLLPIIVVFIFLQRYFVEGIQGAVKA